VLDASGSIIYKSGANSSSANYINWNLMKAFVITLIRSLSVSANQTRIALVRFSHESSIVFQLDSYWSAQQAIQVTVTLRYELFLLTMSSKIVVSNDARPNG